jgi:hypothetical protein
VHRSRTERLHRVALVAAAVLVLGLTAGATAGAQRGPVSVTPPGPLGTSYSEWAARWWQWALGQPANASPLTDTTGRFCARGQRGRMWFLAGTMGGPAVTRRCTIPRGKWLLFPIVNSFSGSIPSDPPEQKTEAFQRGVVAGVRGATNLSVRLDGRRLRRPRRYLEYSTVFRVSLPAGNLFGLDASCQPSPEPDAGCVISPTVDAGFYVAVPPLAAGRHRLHFTGTIPPSAPDGSPTEVDVTYVLTVPRRR